MKRIILFSFITLFAFVNNSGCPSAFSAPPREMGCSSTLSAPPRENSFTWDYKSLNDTLPDLNRDILSFVNAHMKKKVGRGECWDLAAEALNAAGAKWNGKFQFGRKLEKDEAILPGDIIQFEGVKIKYEEGNARYTEVMKHHTGIVYSMKGQRSFDMANQNTEAHGKRVSIIFVDLDKITSGHYSVYRPVPGN